MNKKSKFILSFIIFLFINSFNSRQLFSTGWYDIYFTSPGKKGDLHTSRKNPELGLVAEIKNTAKSFYGAFYDLTSKPVIDELINAKNRGVDVRLVLERDNYTKPEVRRLLKSGIEIVTDDRRGLMHNKFAIIDKRVLWTGSYNPTYNGAFKNNNNAMKIQSEDLAYIYLQEFDEMFKEHIFGNKKEYTIFPAFKKKYYCKIENTDINVYFSPEDNIERIIIKRLKKTKETIHFMSFSFTSDKMANELIRLHKNGVKIFGIFEKVGSNSRHSEYTKLKLEGIQIILDSNKKMMHHKVIVIDGTLLITGSYNFSKNANERNDENIIIINNKIIADKYIEEFLNLFQ